MGILTVLFALACGISRAEQPSPEALAGFDTYVGALEARLEAQHRQDTSFVVLPGTAAQAETLHDGKLFIENLTPDKTNNLPGATIYHWRGTAFLREATAAEFERLMRDFAAYPSIYAPQIVSARVLSQDGDRFQAIMRVKQKHVITVVLDTSYAIDFGQLDPGHGWSVSRSTHIDEVDNAGEKNERVLSPADEHGFLWRLNTYWTFAEGDGGLYVQVESVTLARSIPSGLGWVIGPFVESVPRGSLEFTLRATRYALHR